MQSILIKPWKYLINPIIKGIIEVNIVMIEEYI